MDTIGNIDNHESESSDHFITLGRKGEPLILKTNERGILLQGRLFGPVLLRGYPVCGYPES